MFLLLLLKVCQVAPPHTFVAAPPDEGIADMWKVISSFSMLYCHPKAQSCHALCTMRAGNQFLS